MVDEPLRPAEQPEPEPGPQEPGVLSGSENPVEASSDLARDPGEVPDEELTREAVDELIEPLAESLLTEAHSDEAEPAEEPVEEPVEELEAAEETAEPEAEPEAELEPEPELEPELEPEAGGESGESEEGEGEAEPAAEAAAAAPAPARTPRGGEEPNWFVIHCYSGYENKVRHNLEQRIESMGMQDLIFDVVVPTEEEIEVKEGKRRTVERRVFPGYILVQMVMNDDSWYVVRNTPGVTGFVGMGNKPTALRPEEVSQIMRRMEAEAPKVKVTFKPGQRVRIIDGPFNDFMGTVAGLDMERNKVRVLVSFFGRETPVELDFLQVEKM